MKQHSWLINVCEDIRDYANKNDLPEIAAASTQVILAAIAELGMEQSPAEHEVIQTTVVTSDQKADANCGQHGLVTPFRQRF